MKFAIEAETRHIPCSQEFGGVKQKRDKELIMSKTLLTVAFAAITLTLFACSGDNDDHKSGWYKCTLVSLTGQETCFNTLVYDSNPAEKLPADCKQGTIAPGTCSSTNSTKVKCLAAFYCKETTAAECTADGGTEVNFCKIYSQLYTTNCQKGSKCQLTFTELCNDVGGEQVEKCSEPWRSSSSNNVTPSSSSPAAVTGSCEWRESDWVSGAKACIEDKSESYCTSRSGSFKKDGTCAISTFNRCFDPNNNNFPCNGFGKNLCFDKEDRFLVNEIYCESLLD